MEDAKKNKPVFMVQWHITGLCGNHCRHCYMDKRGDGLPLDQMYRIVDSIKQMMLSLDCDLRLTITGGDPLLSPHLFEIIRYIRARIPECGLAILGNPEHLDDATIAKLKTCDLLFYQISLDGLEGTHDHLRYPGSFIASLSGLRKLREAGIKTAVMSTVSLANIDQMPQLVDLVVGAGVNRYEFSRFVPVGSGKGISSSAFIDPLQFRKFLSRMDARYAKYAGGGTEFGRKDPLWKLYDYETGKFVPRDDDQGMIWDGCVIGVASLIILENGDVLGCRRLPTVIGRVPEQSLEDIFLRSEELNCLRQYEKIEACQKCVLMPYCRGCRAMALGINGDYFSPDPQCWRLND